MCGLCEGVNELETASTFKPTSSQLERSIIESTQQLHRGTICVLVVVVETFHCGAIASKDEEAVDGTLGGHAFEAHVLTETPALDEAITRTRDDGVSIELCDAFDPVGVSLEGIEKRCREWRPSLGRCKATRHYRSVVQQHNVTADREAKRDEGLLAHQPEFSPRK